MTTVLKIKPADETQWFNCRLNNPFQGWINPTGSAFCCKIQRQPTPPGWQGLEQAMPQEPAALSTRHRLPNSRQMEMETLHGKIHPQVGCPDQPQTSGRGNRSMTLFIFIWGTHQTHASSKAAPLLPHPPLPPRASRKERGISHF